MPVYASNSESMPKSFFLCKTEELAETSAPLLRSGSVGVINQRSMNSYLFSTALQTVYRRAPSDSCGPAYYATESLPRLQHHITYSKPTKNQIIG